MATGTEAAYLAGLIDGEGTLVPWKGGGSSRSLSFCNTNLEVIEWAAERWPGGGIHARQQREPHHLPQWALWWTGKAAILNVLDDIEPFLIIKRDRARALREDCETIRHGGHAPGMKRKTHCKRGHSRAGLPLGAGCPECRAAARRNT